MMKTRYTIQEAIDTVAESLRGHSDHSATTIRCAINDCLDAAEKDGYRVHHGYDQHRAIFAVLQKLSRTS